MIPQPEVLKLTFEGTSLDGLVIRVKCCTVGEWNSMLRESSIRSKNTGEVAEGNDKVTQQFLDYVVNWTLETSPGNIAPVTIESFSTLLSSRQGALIISGWQRAMVEVPTTSSKGSSNGESSLEQQLDLAKSLESLPSWTPPSS